MRWSDLRYKTEILSNFKKSSKLKTVVSTQNVSSSSGNTSKRLVNENTVIHNKENSKRSR